MLDQQHPLYSSDRAIVDKIIQEGQSDYNLAELARLKIRYNGFPGARDIQADLEKLLQQWELTEAELYQKTRQIHANSRIYQVRSNKKEKEDWS
ncbi:MAG TPA: DUF3288 domain-containing protein [Cyanobacteria bacterium UBA11369]|nr:DUF3288 domain-containing protein [Cyanobacteria bacterium UBA11371]HBE33851.1 DUF3288 domain-containing protein [Cyanobacteria bacterium UBA11368]HBE48907.1 DUF3288 domain-containing protein [Cyanobacteria bacterium UBA11369]